MEPVKDHHLNTPEEANRDKHINFLAEENGDVDPADKDDSKNDDKSDDLIDDTNIDTSDVDNGFFGDEEKEELKSTEKKEITPNNLSIK